MNATRSTPFNPGRCPGFFGTDFVKHFTKVNQIGRRSEGAIAPMGSEFTPVFLLLIVAIGIAASMIIGSALLAPKKLTRVKQMPYESGMDPATDARQRFDVRFYLVAIVFLAV